MEKEGASESLQIRVCPPSDRRLGRSRVDHPSFAHSMGSLGRLPLEVLKYVLEWLRAPSDNIPFTHVTRCRMCWWIARFTLHGRVPPPPCRNCGGHHGRGKSFFLSAFFSHADPAPFQDLSPSSRVLPRVPVLNPGRKDRAGLQAQRAVVRGTRQQARQQQPRTSQRPSVKPR